ILLIIAILFYSQSHYLNHLQYLFSIYFKFCGFNVRGFDILHALGITISVKWTSNAVVQLGAAAMTEVQKMICTFPWIVSYDNLHLTFKVFLQ
ncbi:hypothetical protein C8Q75DRAFT_710718, partial [Abortiporus biennis]